MIASPINVYLVAYLNAAVHEVRGLARATNEPPVERAAHPQVCGRRLSLWSTLSARPTAVDTAAAASI